MCTEDTGALPHVSTVRDALAWAARWLSASEVPSPRLDAEVLLAHVLGWRRARLYAVPEFRLTEAQRQTFLAFAERRRRHEPVPYITGHREFYGLDFVVDRRAMIPRPETELLVERALESLTHVKVEAGALTAADVGTGNGIVAICLAVHLPQATICAMDVSIEALEVAALNVHRHGVSNRVHLLAANLLEPLHTRVHLIVANLPYISTTRMASLASDVVDYEPRVALDGGADGLQHIRSLLAEAGRRLLPQGVILLEIGAYQGRKVSALAQQHFSTAQVDVLQDYAGLDRNVRIRT